MTNLNPQQKEELIESYVELIVDSMDTKDLVRYAKHMGKEKEAKLSRSS